ncbi:MAG: HPr family phosphocarrier protein [Kordiimonas sp.]
MSEKISEQVEIANRRGLHARASALFAKTAGGFSAKIEVCKGDTCVVGTSIMGLMMLGAAKGDTVAVSAIGEDAEGALSTLVDLIKDMFGEGE